MPYVKTTWVEKSTKLGPTNMNNIENGISKAPFGSDATVNQVPIWNGSAWTYQAPPGHDYINDEYTVGVTTTTTTEATATTIKTASPITVDGTTSVWIEFFCPSLTLAANAAGNVCFIVLYEDGVSIGKLGEADTALNGQMSVPVFLRRHRTPASGVRTYSIRAYHTNAACAFNAGPGGVGSVMPGYIRISQA